MKIKNHFSTQERKSSPVMYHIQIRTNRFRLSIINKRLFQLVVCSNLQPAFSGCKHQMIPISLGIKILNLFIYLFIYVFQPLFVPSSSETEGTYGENIRVFTRI